MVFFFSFYSISWFILDLIASPDCPNWSCGSEGPDGPGCPGCSGGPDGHVGPDGPDGRYGFGGPGVIGGPHVFLLLVILYADFFK